MDELRNFCLRNPPLWQLPSPDPPRHDPALAAWVRRRLGPYVGGGECPPLFRPVARYLSTRARTVKGLAAARARFCLRQAYLREVRAGGPRRGAGRRVAALVLRRWTTRRR